MYIMCIKVRFEFATPLNLCVLCALRGKFFVSVTLAAILSTHFFLLNKHNSRLRSLRIKVTC